MQEADKEIVMMFGAMLALGKETEEVKKRMIANKENPAQISEAAPEEETLLERSIAPTVRDLSVAAKDLLKTIEAEADSTSPNGRLTEQPD
jgi:hypothetical protein